MVLALLRWCGIFHVDNSQLELEVNVDSYIDFLERRKLDGLFYLATKTTSVTSRLYEKLGLAQRAAWIKLLHTLAEADLDPVVIKGAEIREAYYHGSAIGVNHDIDILVPQSKLGAVKRVLFSSGYGQYGYDRVKQCLMDLDISKVAATEARHYELAPFIKAEEIRLEHDEVALAEHWGRHPLRKIDNKIFLLNQVDVHHRIALDIPPEPLFERAVQSKYGVGKTLSPADHIWFMTSRLYNEVAVHGKLSLRDFAYILPIVAQEEIDWDIVTLAADLYHIHSSLYYYLRFVSSLAPGKIPDMVLERVHPSMGTRRADFGWQLSKLFETVDPPPFSITELH